MYLKSILKKIVRVFGVSNETERETNLASRAPRPLSRLEDFLANTLKKRKLNCN